MIWINLILFYQHLYELTMYGLLTLYLEKYYFIQLYSRYSYFISIMYSDMW